MPYDPYLLEETFLVATKCCLIRDGRVLVLTEVRPSKPLWLDLPGGKISKADKALLPEQSLLRELREELGDEVVIDAAKLELFMVHKAYETIGDRENTPIMFLCYRYHLDNEIDVTLSDEHADFRWVALDEIDGLSGWRPGFDEIVRRALGN